MISRLINMTRRAWKKIRVQDRRYQLSMSSGNFSLPASVSCFSHLAPGDREVMGLIPVLPRTRTLSLSNARAMLMCGQISVMFICLEPVHLSLLGYWFEKSTSGDLLFYNRYLGGVKKNSSHAHETGYWYLLFTKFTRNTPVFFLYGTPSWRLNPTVWHHFQNLAYTQANEMRLALVNVKVVFEVFSLQSDCNTWSCVSFTGKRPSKLSVFVRRSNLSHQQERDWMSVTCGQISVMFICLEPVMRYHFNKSRNCNKKINDQNQVYLIKENRHCIIRRWALSACFYTSSVNVGKLNFYLKLSARRAKAFASVKRLNLFLIFW